MRRINLFRRNALIVAAFLVMSASAAFAQTDTPVPPTATPGINFSPAISNQFFEQSNFWIDVFVPVIAIGIGIAIAIALLTFIGKQILGAFG